MNETKVTQSTVRAAIRSGIGRKLDLDDAARTRIQDRKDEQAARLARIAARAEQR